MLSTDDFLPILACPVTHAPLLREGSWLTTADGCQRFRIDDHGVVCFAEGHLTEDVERQRDHYDRVAEVYVANLGYPHTQEYMAYLDRCLFEVIGAGDLGEMAELCCGQGDAIALLDGRYRRAIGVDISSAMLSVASRRHQGKPCGLLQADVTRLPLVDASLDSVVMLGGIHHVPDRPGLYAEILRVLKPGGRFLWREPVNDWFLWRWIRAAIYRLSPALDHETEAPLRHAETKAQLERSGLVLKQWRPAGFIGFCLFMNSDVMVINRLFRFLPGVRAIVRLSAMVDDRMVRVPRLARMGLQVVGEARRPGG